MGEGQIEHMTTVAFENEYPFARIYKPTAKMPARFPAPAPPPSPGARVRSLAHLLDDFRRGLDVYKVGDLFDVSRRVREHVLVAEEHHVLRVGLRRLVPLKHVVEPRPVLTPCEVASEKTCEGDGDEAAGTKIDDAAGARL